MAVQVEQLITEHLDLWTQAQTAKSTSGRGSNNKIELTGVKKLRELILELAVRGKLVPQDPNDEPASELLKRIAVEKEAMVKAGKLKKQKTQPLISDEEEPFELPKGWLFARLAELALPQAGFAFKSNAFNENGDGLPLIRIRDVGQDFSGTYYSGEYRDEFLVISGDYLISMDGNFRVAPWSGDVALLNQRVSRLIFFGDLTEKMFVAESLQAQLLKLQGVKAYTTVDHLSGSQIANSVIGLPPHSEQIRIVTRLGELMSLCDQLEQQSYQQLDAHNQLVDALLATLIQSQNADELASNWQRLAAHFDTLFTTEYSIEALKQTILQLAVMGKLVKQDPNDEPASELLKRIAAEKDALVKAGKIKKQKSLPPISDDEKPFELPQGWEWVRFSDVANSRLGKMLDKAKNLGEMKPYLRNTNVQWGVIELDDIKSMRFKEDELTEFKLEYGDLLICEGGYPGRCAIWKHKTIEMYFQKALHRARPFSGVTTDYLQLCIFNDLNTGGLNKYITGATIQHFTGEKLDKYVIPLPPVAIQSRVISRVTDLINICDIMLKSMSSIQQTQSVLAESMVEQVVA
ncbi:restriction endonuclease subunit S [Rheinheimera sp. UJ51]|uniref:restriction endonuclease subunit S n=1 Tax=Rheinheimera sp. UJ51 TaxID=2892446 RepID=UPI001E5D1875|nr:restriction endonuclease subunit S [Rheinheimera sp. UJ51]MCC5453372.1 restriction endonuclease subunit S [Rheinheimera sp. UJ51]